MPPPREANRGSLGSPRKLCRLDRDQSRSFGSSIRRGVGFGTELNRDPRISVIRPAVFVGRDECRETQRRRRAGFVQQKIFTDDHFALGGARAFVRLDVGGTGYV